MKRFVALLRGVNVGRAKRVAMADLRELLVSLGYEDVRTLLNSGNAIFVASSGTPEAHAKRIRLALADEIGLHAQVLVKSGREFGSAAAANPLLSLAADPSRCLVLFTQRPSDLSVLSGLAEENWSPEAFAVGAHAAYLWCPSGVLESRVAQAVNRALGERGTARNWATVKRIQTQLNRQGSEA